MSPAKAKMIEALRAFADALELDDSGELLGLAASFGALVCQVNQPAPQARKSQPSGMTSTERSRACRARKASHATLQPLQSVAATPHATATQRQHVATVAPGVANEESAAKHAFSASLQTVSSVAWDASRVNISSSFSDPKEENKKINDARDATPPVAPVASKAPKQQRATVAPSEADEAAWLTALGIQGDPHDISHWLDHHRAKGSRFVSWAASWRTWVRNGIQYGTIQPPTQPAPKPKPRDPNEPLFDCSELLASLTSNLETVYKTPLQQAQEALNAF